MGMTITEKNMARHAALMSLNRTNHRMSVGCGIDERHHIPTGS